jgi:anti-sigma factor RsiW
MSCERADGVLHAYFDNELDALGAAEFERHLEHCGECTEALGILKSLRSSLNAERLYQKTPASLRQKLLVDLPSPTPIHIVPARPPWRWLAMAAAIVLVAATAWQIISSRRGLNQETALAAEAIDAHLRSLQPGHLTDVISTDQHTVKPWFDGKLDFAPPVRDFADQGFQLQGGRLDIVHGRTIAALVYGRRKHLVSAFVWPTIEPDTAPRSGSEQGYQWMIWRKAGMEFCIVSDAAPADLQQLQRLFSELR